MGKIKSVQVKIPEELYVEAKMKLLKRDQSWQEFFLKKVKALVNPPKSRGKRLKKK